MPPQLEVGLLAGVLLAAACVTSWRRRQRAAVRAASKLGKNEVLALRRRHCCNAQSVSYANTGPLMIMRGRGQFLYDEDGVQYLDTRNNVAHLGHCHPAVATAVSDQVHQLNTNTRYLHPNMVALADALLSKCPAPLSKVFFVNSGTEANDLALRLARAHTGQLQTVVVDHGYHGHSLATIDISPYKFDHPRGTGRAQWVQKVPCPDLYRGSLTGAGAGAALAAEVGRACDQLAASHGGVCAMFVESGMSVGGVVLPPPGYLRDCYAHVRRHGGVCVADEVQVGLGRIGTHFWGFEQQGVVPDIVTLGKPFGNGMPLAAVITTSDIAESFAAGPEYFNTFGGNPVACAAGLAVLHSIEAEALQQHAAQVGEYLMCRLRRLQERQPLIGDVRGSGLFVGVEFVTDRVLKIPAVAEASMICSRLKTVHRILTSLDGPSDTVMVIKPPMCFAQDDVDKLVYALDQELTDLALNPPPKVAQQHTPT